MTDEASVALAGALDARGAIIVALWGRQVTADLAVMADTILRNLPEGWALVSIEQVAARLHETHCERSQREHGPDAHLGEARRLFHECRSSHAAGAIPAPGAGPSEGDTTAPDHAPEPLPTGSGAPAPEDRP